jgi:hypothetical protein
MPNVQFKEFEALEGVKHASLEATILGANARFTCTGTELVGVSLEATGALATGFKVKFTGCEYFINGTLSSKCEAKTAGQTNGTILSNELKGSLQLLGADKVVVVQPKTGEEFLTVAAGSKCSLGEEVPIVGTLALEDPELEVNKADHLFKVNAANTKMGVFDLKEGNKAKIIGSAIVSLSGAHAGLSWRGLVEASQASWEVTPPALTPNVQFKEFEALEGVKHASLEATILGGNVRFTCTGAELVGATIEASGAIATGFKAKFTGCVTFLNGTVAPKCEAKTAGQANGTILSGELKGLLQLLGAEKVVVVQPKTGEEFLTVATSAKCSFGENVPVVGTLALEDPELEVNKADHLFKVNAANTKMGVFDLNEGNKAKIIGSAIVSLSGAHAGLSWRGLVP